ncbi:HAD-IIB family hydrolase [Paraglaciecola sp.]|uniref:HAD-IIB family hydrolase n=1 Tax=Paraglaciecola sp. TaxID=1920173 RepID=UPI003EF21BB9
MNKQYVIFTDLDGTLLDHYNYSFAPALKTLEKLKQQNIPVIANTSKTFAELVEIRGALQLNTPFIVENGAAVYIPTTFFKHQPIGTKLQSGYWVKEFSKPVSHWLELLENIKTGFEGEFDHFSNMSIEQISQATGLSPHDAQLASQREYCEPVLWLGDEPSKQLFVQASQELGASPLQGGRFLHITGECNKGQALSWLFNEYKKCNGQADCYSIALGDGHNDIHMLEVADIAIRILSPTNPPPKLKRTKGVMTSSQCGPSGWAECIDSLIFS